MTNGNFEKLATDGRPQGWEPIRRPGIDVVDTGPSQGRVLRLSVSRKVARSTGLMCRSDPIPATPGRTYDIGLDVRGDGLTVIVFVRGYARFRGRERVIYSHKKEAQVERGKWTRFESHFTPRGPAGQEALRRRGLEAPSVEFLRVELFACGAEAGVAEFDNVSLTERNGSKEPPASPEKRPVAPRGSKPGAHETEGPGKDEEPEKDREAAPRRPKAEK